MGTYYYLSASLPPLAIDRELEITFSELMFRFQMNLTPSDYAKVKIIRELIDIGNILHCLKGEPIDKRGNLSQKELEEALLNRMHLPEYIFEVLDRYDDLKEQVQHFNEVYAQFFNKSLEKSRGFLHAYLMLEQSLRRVLLAYRAKQRGRDLIKEFQFEDFSDPLVAYIIAQKENSTLEFPYGYEVLGSALAGASDPLSQYRLILEYRLKATEALCEEPEFDIDWLLSYMVRLILIEDWAHLSEEKGKLNLQKVSTKS